MSYSCEMINWETNNQNFSPPCLRKISTLKTTSKLVTRTLNKIKAMIIHVIRPMLDSAIESDRISSKSNNTSHRSFNTWTRELNSRYSTDEWPRNKRNNEPQRAYHERQNKGHGVQVPIPKTIRACQARHHQAWSPLASGTIFRTFWRPHVSSGPTRLVSRVLQAKTLTMSLCFPLHLQRQTVLRSVRSHGKWPV